MGGAKAEAIEAKSPGKGESWPGASPPLSPAVAGSVIPHPPALPLNDCLCVPSWDTPFGRALGKKWEALP